jgi:hypothetical protein
MQAAICRAHLHRLASGGVLAGLLAQQAAAFDAQWHNAERYAQAPGVAADMINFLYDPVACAIAAGWRTGVEIQALPVAWEIRDTYLVQRIAPGGKCLSVVVGIDGPALEEQWVQRVSGSHQRASAGVVN